MALYTSEQAAGRKPTATLFEAGAGGIRYEYLITANLVAGDVVYLGDFPANGLLPVDAILISDDLDSNGTPTITLTAGVLNAGKTALGVGANDTWIASTTIGQTGGVARTTTAAVSLSGPQEFTARPLGVVIGAGAATAAMIGKKIVLMVNTAA